MEKTKTPTTKKTGTAPPKDGAKGNKTPNSTSEENTPKGKNSKRETTTKSTKEEVRKRGFVAGIVLFGTKAVNVVFNSVATVNAQLPKSSAYFQDAREMFGGYFGLTTPLNSSLNEVIGFKSEEIVSRFYGVAFGLMNTLINASKKSKNPFETELAFVTGDGVTIGESMARLTTGGQPEVPQPWWAKTTQASR